eukprot:7640493-Alexandrium_andersonii.AAC.1
MGGTATGSPDLLIKVRQVAPDLPRGGHGPGTPSGPKAPLRGSESAKVGGAPRSNDKHRKRGASRGAF